MCLNNATQFALVVLGLCQIRLGSLHVPVRFGHHVCQLALEVSNLSTQCRDFLGGSVELRLLAVHQPLLVTEGGLEVALALFGPHELRLEVLEILGRFVGFRGLVAKLALQLGNPLILRLDLLGCIGQLPLQALHQPLVVAEGGLQVVLGLLGPDQIHLGILQMIGCLVRFCSLVAKLALQLGNPAILRLDLLGRLDQLPLLTLHKPLLVTEGGLQVVLGLLGPGQIHLGILQMIGCLVCFSSLLPQLALELGNPIILVLDLLGGLSQFPLLALHEPLLVAEGGLQVVFSLLGPGQISLGILHVISCFVRFRSLLPQLALQLGNSVVLGTELLGGVNELPLLALHEPLLVAKG